MNSINFYKYLALILIGFVVLVLFFILLFAKPSSQVEGPQPNRSYTVSSQEDIQRGEQYALVGQMIKKLPHQGKYFKLEYSFVSNTFILTLNQNQQVLGENEFEAFLKDNQILSKDWLQNLQIIVK